MAEKPEPNKVITAFRTLQYTGPAWWIEETLAKSRVPPYGVLNDTKNGAYVRSGLTHFDDPYMQEQAAEEEQEERRLPITLPPPGGRPS